VTTGASSRQPQVADTRSTAAGSNPGVMRSTTVDTASNAPAMSRPSPTSTAPATSTTRLRTTSPLAGRLSHGTRASGGWPARARAASPATRRPPTVVSSAGRPARRAATSAATAGWPGSGCPSGPTRYPASVTVSVTSAVDGAASRAHQASRSPPWCTAASAPTGSNRSPSGPRVTTVYIPSWSASRSIRADPAPSTRPPNAAMPHASPSSARSVNQAACARWKAPSPRWTIRTGGGVADRPAPTRPSLGSLPVIGRRA
jgi:hypothetical protein